MIEQPNFPIMDHGIVICPSDPDVVTGLRLKYTQGELSLQEFEKRLDEVAWV